MSDTLSEILIIDVEATCWRGPNPPGEQNEIIEIGACLLDPKRGERSAGRSILVRPERSRVSPFCTELTSLTQEMVDQGVDFAAACDLLEAEFQSTQRVWASYGAYDRKQFQRQCQAGGVRYPFSARHINVKSAFAQATMLPRPVGMAGALAKLQLPLEGTHHRGGDDAWNIAAILKHLLLEKELTPTELVGMSATDL